MKEHFKRENSITKIKLRYETTKSSLQVRSGFLTNSVEAFIFIVIRSFLIPYYLLALLLRCTNKYVERERERGEKPYSHSLYIYLRLRDIYIQG